MTEKKICEVGGKGVIFPLFGDDEQGWPKEARAIRIETTIGRDFHIVTKEKQQQSLLLSPSPPSVAAAEGGCLSEDAACC